MNNEEEITSINLGGIDFDTAFKTAVELSEELHSGNLLPTLSPINTPETRVRITPTGTIMDLFRPPHLTDENYRQIRREIEAQLNIRLGNTVEVNEPEVEFTDEMIKPKNIKTESVSFRCGNCRQLFRTELCANEVENKEVIACPFCGSYTKVRVNSQGIIPDNLYPTFLNAGSFRNDDFELPF